jgi:hypothetical protein
MILNICEFILPAKCLPVAGEAAAGGSLAEVDPKVGLRACADIQIDYLNLDY